MSKASLQIRAIDFLKTNRLMAPVYRKLKTRKNKANFSVKSIHVFRPVRSEETAPRLNLVLPTLRKTRVFAGINSALNFFLKLIEGSEIECRIIVIGDEPYGEKTTYQVKGFSHQKEAKRRLIFFYDRDEIDVRANDIFMLTSWKTAFSFSSVIKWQRVEFVSFAKEQIYLIQDYEPGFFAWSSEYVLAESTYREFSDSMIAVFNSAELYEFFKNKGYSFKYESYFRPALNRELKRILLEKGDSVGDRKKRILIYGRPSEQRNAFEVVRASLDLWSQNYASAREWEVISLGEGFEDVELAHSKIISKGKVTLAEYAEYMLSSYVGISLMVSPHPSYPPLEMSTFGVRTITNKYENKDLQSFNQNVISIDNCSPDNISRILTGICDEYGSVRTSFGNNSEYLSENDIDKSVAYVRCLIGKYLKDEKYVV